MNFLDGHLYPQNQQPLIITAAPCAPVWIPSDFPEDIPITMEEQIQKAVDCYEAGATVLHLHVREADGKGSKRLSMFNDLIAGVRKAVPEMIIQVGGSISFAPEGPDGEVKWPSDDTHHMLAEESANFQSLVNDVRREQALRLIEGQIHNITEVAQLVGFAETSAFSRWFGQQFGVAPSRWKKD